MVPFSGTFPDNLYDVLLLTILLHSFSHPAQYDQEDWLSLQDHSLGTLKV